MYNKPVLLEEIKLHALDLGIDQSVNMKCPFCEEMFIRQGRPSHIWTPNNSLSITRIPEGILYHCFRASCTGGGLIPSLYTDRGVKPLPKFQAKEYMYPTRALTDKNRMYLNNMFGLLVPEMYSNGIVYSPERDSYIFPIINEDGHVKGYLDRNYSGRKPKTINYWFEDVPKLHFPDSWNRTNTDSVLLVEDTVSAIVASRYMSTISLLGTNLTVPVLEKIRSLTGNVTLALDEDASKKALEYKKKYSTLFLNFSVKLLSKDIKNMNTEELDKEFNI